MALSNLSPRKSARARMEELNRERLRADLENEIEALKARLADAAEEKSASTMASLRDGYAKLQDQVRSFLDSDLAHDYGIDTAVRRGEEKFREARDTVQKSVQEKPVQTALIAVGVVALVGLLLRRD